MHTVKGHAIGRAAWAAVGLGALFMAIDAFGQTGSGPVARGVHSLAARTSTAAAANSRGREAPPRLACTSVTAAEPLTLALGKSQVVPLSSPAIRLINGGRASSWVGAVTDEQRPSGSAAPAAPATGAPDGVAETEITLLSPNELLILGRRPGSANVIVQDREGRCVVRDITITVDPQTLRGKLRELLPRESDVHVSGAGDSVVLTGSVTDAVTLDQILTVASAYADQKKIVNMLRVTAPQQVMLEVQIAEVSKTLLDRLGLNFSRVVSGANHTNIISGIIGGTPGLLGHFGPNVSSGDFVGAADTSVSAGYSAAAASVANRTRGASLTGLNAQDRDGVVRLLAEPNIMAISGQAASFLSGGKIFIPVAQSNNAGGTVVTLEEKEFGVGLKFTPTVLDGRINLKVVSEVSELSQSGSPFTTVGGVTSVIPSMTTRRVDTTVQLGDGQSFAVAGLIRQNYTGALDKFPGLGEVPIMGALFRSTEFQNDQTELLFVITPHLVKPTTGRVALPTDSLVVPNRTDLIFRGKAEGSLPPPVAPAAPVSVPAQPAAPVRRPLSGLPSQTAVASATPVHTLPPPQALPPLAPASLLEQPHFD